MPKCYYDQIVIELLRLTPGHAYITPDGKKLFALVGEENSLENPEGVLEFTGPDFSTMTDEDVNTYIVETLSKFKL